MKECSVERNLTLLQGVFHTFHIYEGNSKSEGNLLFSLFYKRHTRTKGTFEKFVDWQQCAAVMYKGAVTVMPSCSGGGNVVVA
jgi:hypothetical protein